MTHIRKYRFLALLACVAMLAVVCGCHSVAAAISHLLGSWFSDDIELVYSAMAVILSHVDLGFGSHTGGSSGSSAVGAATVDNRVELWATVEGGNFINYVGTFTQNGDNVTANLTPRGVKAEQVNGDTIALDLQADSETKLSGTMTWVRDGSPFTGPCTFDKYPNQ